MDFLYSIHLAILGPLVIIGFVGLSIAGLWLFQKFTNREGLKESHDVAGFIYAVVGVIYAVVLAFVVIVVWEQYREADKVSQEEACHVGNLRRLAVSFPDSIRTEIKARTLEYLESVVAREWPAMATGHEDQATYLKVETIWKCYNQYHPEEPQEAAYNESLRELAGFTTDRRLRVIRSSATIPPILWLLLFGGGVVSILFTYFFTTPKPGTQYMMTGLLAALIALTLFLIIAMDRPFSGEFRVAPDAFEYLIHHAEVSGS